MKKIAMMLVACLCLTCSLVSAKSQWTLGVGGNDDQFGFLVGMRPSEDARTEYRLTFAYYDGIRESTQEAISFAAGITYDVIQDAEVPFEFPWGIGKGTLKVTGYVGGEAGPVVNTKGPSNYDAMANGIIGVGIGDKVNRACLEGLLGIDPSKWKELANLDNTKTLRLVFVHRFP